MRNTLNYTILLVILLFSTAAPTFAQDNDSIEIWSEDFTSRFQLPETGKNAVYEYSTDGVRMSRQNGVGAIHPELQISQGGKFTATIALHEASGKFRLSFYSDKPSSTNVEISTSGVECTKVANTVFELDVPAGNDSLSIIFSNPTNSSSKNIFLDDIVLKASADCRQSAKQSPEISYSANGVVVTFGQTYSLPTLDNPHDLPICYWNYDDSIASVDPKGDVTIRSVGKTKITAIFQGDDQYSYQETSYDLTVERNKPEDEIFYESFDKNLSVGGNDGAFAISSSGNSAVAEYDNPTQTVTTSNIRSAYKCIIVGSSSSSETYEIGSIDKLTGDCKLCFRVAGMANGKATCEVEVYNKTKAILTESVECISNKWLYKEIFLTGLKSSYTIKFTGHYFYLDDVSIIADSDKPVSVSMTTAGYATLYYGSKALTVPDGMEAYTMKVDNDKIVKSHSYVAGATIPKATAVVLKANAGIYSLEVATDGGEADDANMLKGSDGESTTEGGELYYKLACPKDAAGFYWGAKDGGAFINGAHKAYLALQKAANASKTSKSYVFNFNNVPTDIGTVARSESAHALYNLHGQRVGKDYKGIVVSKGRKMIVK